MVYASDLVLISKKKKWSSGGFCYSSMKLKESKKKKKKRKIPGSCQRAEKAAEHEDDGDNNCS